MSYQIARMILNKERYEGVRDYAETFALLSRNLYNAALFRIRQNFTSKGKETLSDNEKEVLSEIEQTMFAYEKAKPGRVISYGFLEKMMRANGNPDFFNDLPMQTSQAVLKEAVKNFKTWLSALRDFKTHPEKYTGKPKMPKYLKKDKLHTFVITNQDAVLYDVFENDAYKGKELKLPLTKERIFFSNIPKDAMLKEVKIKPFFDTFEILLTFESEDAEALENNGLYLGIDFGVRNTMAIVTNEGHSLLCKGGFIKARNQYFNKKKAKIVSEMSKGKEHFYPSCKRLDRLSKDRECFMLDIMHKESRSVIDFCLEHNINTIVIGHTNFWKQETNIGHRNNQEFVSIPFVKLQEMIEYKARNAGINVIIQEESYTSKADFLSFDEIPVYGEEKEKEKPKFSGVRKRGLYHSGTGNVFNSDLNGAANILRKAVPNAFDKVKDFGYLMTPKVLNFKDFYVV